MRNIRTFLLFSFLLSFLSFPSFAQSSYFKVLATKGAVTYKTPSSTLWKKAFVGSKLHKGSQIKVASGAYLGLVYSNGKSVVIKTPGTYSVDKLAVGASKKTSSMQKFASYAYNEVTKVNKPTDIKSYHQKHMKLTGNVERASFNVLDPPLFVFIEKETHVLDQKNVTFTWFKYKKYDEYLFTLTDEIGKPIFEKTVKDTTFTADLTSYNLKPHKCYNWIVSPTKLESKESEEMCIQVYNEEKSKHLNSQLTEFEEEKNALDYTILASFYEEHKLYYEANQAYKKAIKMEPEIEDYKKLYALFLTRMGMIDAAGSVWKGE